MATKRGAASLPGGALVPLAALFSTHATILACINHAVRDPYMDEPFHVGQTRQYCSGRYGEWDPKITTPPGLYVIGVAYSAVLTALTALYGAPVGRGWACSTAPLRSVNVFLALAAAAVLYQTDRELNPRRSPWQAAQKAVALSLYPVHFFFAHLYYTDVGAALFILLAHLLVLQRRPWAASVAAAWAMFFRQTNAPWTVFVAAVGVLRELGGAGGSGGASLSAEILRLLRLAWLRKGTITYAFAPLALVVAGALGFLVWNGGVVMGDKSAHAASAHPTQVLYFFGLVLAALGPRYLRPRSVRRVLSTLRGLLASNPMLHGGIMASVAAAAVGCVRGYSKAHPYLLADNRHYVFYLWKDILGRHAAARYAAVPAYLVSAAGVCIDLARAQSAVWALLFVGCTAVVLTPALLLELRYFTVPFLLLALHVPLSRGEIAAAAACFSVVNAATIYVFVMRPFEGPEGTARFIW